MHIEPQMSIDALAGSAEASGTAASVEARIYGEVVDGSSIASIAPSWQELALRAAEPNPFQEPIFVGAFCEHQSRDVRIVLAWRVVMGVARLIGAVAFLVGRPRSRLPIAVLTAPVTTALAFLATPLVDPEFIAQALMAILNAIAANPSLPKNIVLLDLSEGPVMSSLSSVLAARGTPPVVLERRQRAKLSSPLDGAAYFKQSLSAGSRKKLRQHRRRLAAHGDVRHSTHTGAADACFAFERFLALEAAGWKGRHATAILSRDADAAIARTFFQGMAAEGLGWIEALHVGNRMVSAQVMLRSGRAAFTWKIAYDEAFAEYSPGILLIEDYSAKLLSDRGIDFTDSCSYGESGFMAELWTERQEVVDVVFHAGGMRSPTTRLLAAGEGLHIAARQTRIRLGPLWRRSVHYLSALQRKND
jgi:CelD/BcsL family acetyltransferase involved in cellulose biosynthesis